MIQQVPWVNFRTKTKSQLLESNTYIRRLKVTAQSVTPNYSIEAKRILEREGGREMVLGGQGEDVPDDVGVQLRIGRDGGRRSNIGGGVRLLNFFFR